MTNEDWGVIYGLVFASVSPCQEVNSLAAGRACGWDRELLHRFIRQNPHSGGGLETSLQKLSLPRFAHKTGRSSYQPCRAARGDHQPHRPNLVPRTKPIQPSGQDAW